MKISSIRVYKIEGTAIYSWVFNCVEKEDSLSKTPFLYFLRIANDQWHSYNICNFYVQNNIVKNLKNYVNYDIIFLYLLFINPFCVNTTTTLEKYNYILREAI